MKKVLLLSGKINSGKNQLADYLIEELKTKDLIVNTDLFAIGVKDGCKEDFKRLADVLNNIVAEIKVNTRLLFDTKDFDSSVNLQGVEKVINKLLIEDKNWYEDKTDITRAILQLYGTNIFRDRVDTNWWVKQLKARAIASEADVIVVTDTRFPNEIEGVVETDQINYEAIPIRIERKQQASQDVGNHESETALDDWTSWDYIVDNDQSLDALKQSAKTIVDDMFAPSIIEAHYESVANKILKW